MKKICNLFLFLFLSVMTAFGQEEFNTSVPREVLILSSTKSYVAAHKTARAAASFLGWKMELRGYKPHSTNGLTSTKGDCEADGYEYPCYVARAEGSGEDDFNTISIEYSNAYSGLTEGYYIVVAGIGKPKSKRVQMILSHVRKHYPDAYVKATSVWLGCMH